MDEVSMQKNTQARELHNTNLLCHHISFFSEMYLNGKYKKYNEDLLFKTKILFRCSKVPLVHLKLINFDTSSNNRMIYRNRGGFCLGV